MDSGYAIRTYRTHRLLFEFFLEYTDYDVLLDEIATTDIVQYAI